MTHFNFWTKHFYRQSNISKIFTFDLIIGLFVIKLWIQEDLLGVGVYGDPGLALAVKKDIIGIGYNNLAYLYDLKTRKQVAGIRALPIDVNGNGKIDAEENFYGTIDELTQAIGEGKYPSPPSRNLGFLFKGKPKKKELIEFVKYVLTSGQQFVDENGYIPLSKAKLQEELKKVNWFIRYSKVVKSFW